MARRYHRVAGSIWRKPWDDETKLLAFYILTTEHRSTEGLFRMPLDYARSDMSWPTRKFDPRWAFLVDEDFVAYDSDVQVCLIVNALAYQSPENPNQTKAALKIIENLPETPLLDRFGTLARTHAPKFADALCQRFPDRFTTVGEPLANRSETVADGFPQLVSNTPAPTPSPPPTPSSTTPPTPPMGGRARDREKWETEEFGPWIEEHFPGVDPILVRHGLERTRRPGSPATAESARAYLTDKGYLTPAAA